MQVQTNLSSIDPTVRRDQIGLLVGLNANYLLEKYARENGILKNDSLARLIDEINERLSKPSVVADSVFDEERGIITGLVVGEPAPWESGLFEGNIGKIVLSLFEPETKPVYRARILRSVIDQLQARMVSARVSLRDFRTIRALELEGANLADVLLTYRFDLSRGQPSLQSSIEVGPAQESDEPELKRLGRTIFTLDRFHNDERLPYSKSDEAHERWVSNSLHGLADAVLVARRGVEAIGFITCKIGNIGNGFKHGIIELIGVSPSYSGQGLGKHLVRHALRWFADVANVCSVYVGTQASNSQAVRMYERTGFTHVFSEATFHIWSD